MVTRNARGMKMWASNSFEGPIPITWGAMQKHTPSDKNLYVRHRARLGMGSQGDQQGGVGVAGRQKTALVWLCPKAEACHQVSC